MPAETISLFAGDAGEKAEESMKMGVFAPQTGGRSGASLAYQCLTSKCIA